MNFNAIIAVLILKGVITEDEGQRLVEHLNDKPQSTVLKDTVAAVAEVIGKQAIVVHPPLGPVGPAQQAEELAARSASVPLPAPEPELAANEAPLDADQAANGQASPPTDEELDEAAAAKKAEKEGGETYTPETDKDTKTTPVNKPTDETDKK